MDYKVLCATTCSMRGVIIVGCTIMSISLQILNSARTYYSLLRLSVNNVMSWWSAVSAGLILLTKVFDTLVPNLWVL
jgi:hypothetical protein